jgi:hypothetical protein
MIYVGFFSLSTPAPLDRYLRQVDPAFSDHLEEGDIQAQLYGMRWSRLLFGREFPLSHNLSLKLWDYIFGYWLEMDLVKDPAYTGGLNSPTASGREGNRMIIDVGLEEKKAKPIIRAVADLMIAMLLYVSAV